MPAVGRTETVVSENSIGPKATTVALRAAYVATQDGLLEVQCKLSSATAQLQVSEIDTESSPNTDVALLNKGVALTVDALYGPGDLQLWVRNGHSYTFSMVFSTGSPSCDMFRLVLIDLRGDLPAAS